MRATRNLFLLALLAGAMPARGHEAGERAIGTIERVTPEAIVLRAPDGHELVFALSAATRFERGGKDVARDDARAGDRAVVRAKAAGGRMEATRVKLGPAAPAR
ncbi:MAG TPA: hypothetical protein VLS93_02305 [Anaeromyxobacteraceae bacterium]|nr:hypothetical protein [Anaeromyxobacteraceae bacterium]